MAEHLQSRKKLLLRIMDAADRGKALERVPKFVQNRGVRADHPVKTNHANVVDQVVIVLEIVPVNQGVPVNIVWVVANHDLAGNGIPN